MPDVVSPERIAEIRERLEEATTTRPWAIAPCSDSDERRDIVSEYETVDTPEGIIQRAHWIAELNAGTDPELSEMENSKAMEAMCANAEFIAHAPDDIRDLLSALDAAQAERDAAVARAEAAEAELSRLRAQTTWRPIETAPKDGSVVLGWFPFYATGSERGGAYVMRWQDDKYATKARPFWEASGWVWGTRDNRGKQPTHWQPLPPAPANEVK